jgi:hypothetical protein
MRSAITKQLVLLPHLANMVAMIADLHSLDCHALLPSVKLKPYRVSSNGAWAQNDKLKPEETKPTGL